MHRAPGSEKTELQQRFVSGLSRYLILKLEHICQRTIEAVGREMRPRRCFYQLSGDPHPLARSAANTCCSQDHCQRLGPAEPRASAWKDAGPWLILSHSRQVNFSRTCWITFHCRGMTSSVSVMSSPNLAQLRAAATLANRRPWLDHPLAWQMLGEGLTPGASIYGN